MKKLALTSLLAAFAVSSANAATNYFIGGDASYRNDDDHAPRLHLAPEFGWKYNEKLDLGIDLLFGHKHWEHKVNDYSYGAAMFARYDVLSFGDFHMKVKGLFGGQWQIEKYNGHKDSSAGLFVQVYPMLTYDISESFTLYANLNFLGAEGYYRFKHDGNPKAWGFEISADTDNVLNTEDFQIGFTYNF